MYRIHRAVSDAWFFSSGAGRFDPVGVAGRGASYWAEDALGAWVETFRTRMLLPERELDDRRLSVATLQVDVVVCDLTVRRALVAGVTVALTAGGDYSAAQSLADGLQGECPAVRWRLRHDLRQRLIGIAWFGDVEPGASMRCGAATERDLGSPEGPRQRRFPAVRIPGLAEPAVVRSRGGRAAHGKEAATARAGKAGGNETPMDESRAGPR
jgi:hypothetical protein